MSGDRSESTPQQGSRGPNRPRLLDVLDVLAKAMGAVAVLLVAYTANSFQRELNTANRQNQNRATGLTLQSQREQASSQLRAAMFSSLIQPFAGERGAGVSVEREQLLTELLVLNFHEEFDSKPLMQRVDRLLASRPPTSALPMNSYQDPRRELRSIARRVADRQISSLAWDQPRSGPTDHGCEVYWLAVASAPAGDEPSNGSDLCVQKRRFREPVVVKSPHGNSILEVFVLDTDWENETVRVSVVARQADTPGEKPGHSETITYTFTLTWYDLPLTDNTVLPNGDRFAINLRGVSAQTWEVSLRIIWFPPRYFTPREHPLDSRKILALLEQGSRE